MKNKQLEAEQKAQLEVETLEKDLTGLIRQRADQLANKNVELEQIKTQMVQTERMLMDERRESSKLRHQYDEEKERRMNLLKSHESSSESVQALLSRLQLQQRDERFGNETERVEAGTRGICESSFTNRESLEGRKAVREKGAYGKMRSFRNRVIKVQKASECIEVF